MRRKPSTDAAAVRSAIALLVSGVTAAKKPMCAFVNSSTEIAALRELGIRTFIVSSEQGLLRLAATAELAKFKTAAE